MKNRNIVNYTTEYLELSFEDIMVKYRREKCLDIIKNFPHKKILEIGCGTNPLFLNINEFELYYIVEPSSLFCKSALKLAKNDKRINIINDFFPCDIELLKNIHFDIIIISALLHEVELPDIFLQSIYKLCSLNTIVHINVPNIYSFHMLLAYESKIIDKLGRLSDRAKLLQQHNTFSMLGLTDIVANVGFKLIDKGGIFIKIFNHEKMKIMIEQGLLNSDILDGFNNMIKYIPELAAEIYVNIRI
ncbi:class I SAM-dependent methyltransferase [Elizabethkingia anophelis]|uniref:class I SAM-dependent methyltransferase n=1 Tax=Elizabethkingia anophelis TaxID=1117645 RepID=UPI003558CBAB